MLKILSYLWKLWMWICTIAAMLFGSLYIMDEKLDWIDISRDIDGGIRWKGVKK